MADLRITDADLLDCYRVIIDLSDGRSLVLSLSKLLTLEPDEVLIEDDEGDSPRSC